MVNMGRIHRELRKFLMISSNLIKLVDESVIAIGKNGTLWERTWRRIHEIKNQWSWLSLHGEIEDWRGVFSKNCMNEITEIKIEIKENYDS